MISVKAAVRAMSKHDAGILHTPTAFGKTVTAISMITKRKFNMLILVHSKQLYLTLMLASSAEASLSQQEL